MSSGPPTVPDPGLEQDGAGGSDGWSAAILCGGRSRRMGRDKALLVVDGEPMVLRVARALLAAGAARVAVVGGDQAGLRAALEPLAASESAGGAAAALAPQATETPCRGVLATVVAVPDDAPGEGPLGGILTALADAAGPVVLVMACDLVAPSAAAMAATVAALAGDPAADVAAPGRGAQVEWLHAAWRRSAREFLAARFATGERAVHRAVATAGLRVVEVHGLDPDALADADTPAALSGRSG